MESNQILGSSIVRFRPIIRGQVWGIQKIETQNLRHFGPILTICCCALGNFVHDPLPLWVQTIATPTSSCTHTGILWNASNVDVASNILSETFTIKHSVKTSDGRFQAQNQTLRRCSFSTEIIFCSVIEFNTTQNHFLWNFPIMNVKA